jgi:hypothetical protein
MGTTIKIILPNDRTKTGTLTLVDANTGLPLFGPVPVLGRAARNTATAHGNPSGDPLLPFGDTPTGTYNVPNIVRNGTGTTRPTIQYGESGSIVLDPTSGNALTAKNNGRTGLLIHAGRHANSSVVAPSALKPTNGCIRMRDWDLQQLIDAIQANAILFPSTVHVEISGPAGPQGDIDETVDDGDPPPLSGPVILP